MSSSLKGYTPALARIVGATPAALYERQRALVRAGLLTPEGGRGPGSGVRTTAESVALLLIAVLATDNLSQTDERAREIAEASSSEGANCPLTGMQRFKDALASILVSKARSSKVLSLHVSRTEAYCWINYRDKGRALTSAFGIVKSSKLPLRVEAILEGNAVRIIAEDVGSMIEAVVEGGADDDG